jgi:hypothetical protein
MSTNETQIRKSESPYVVTYKLRGAGGSLARSKISMGTGWREVKRRKRRAPGPSRSGHSRTMSLRTAIRCLVGRKNEAKTKPKCGVARAFGVGFGPPKALCLQGVARFLARGDGGSMVRGKLQNEATIAGVRMENRGWRMAGSRDFAAGHPPPPRCWCTGE